MTYEEWRDTTRIMLDFYQLDAEKQEMVLLMIDGLKARAALSPEEKP